MVDNITAAERHESLSAELETVEAQRRHLLASRESLEYDIETERELLHDAKNSKDLAFYGAVPARQARLSDLLANRRYLDASIGSIDGVRSGLLAQKQDLEATYRPREKPSEDTAAMLRRLLE